MAVQSGADGGTPQGHFAQGLLGPLHPCNAQFDLSGIAAEFLSQTDGSRVLQVGPADFDDSVELLAFRSRAPDAAGSTPEEVDVGSFPRRQCGWPWG